MRFWRFIHMLSHIPLGFWDWPWANRFHDWTGKQWEPFAIQPIDPSVLVTMIDRLMRFPFPTICRHSVAADLLDRLELQGAPVSVELARAIVSADDETVLELLPTLGIPYTPRSPREYDTKTAR